MSRSKSGFTIVELLIVIVVIAILATISVIAFNGIQARARNTQTVNAAEAYRKALAIYATTNQAYPPMGTYQCLGTPTCRGGTWNERSSLNSALRAIMGENLPSPSQTSKNDNAGGLVSLALIGLPANATLDGVPTVWLVYELEGSDPCPLGPVASGSWKTFYSTPPASGVTFDNDGSVSCYVALPDPNI